MKCKQHGPAFHSKFEADKIIGRKKFYLHVNTQRTVVKQESILLVYVYSIVNNIDNFVLRNCHDKSIKYNSNLS